MVIFTALCNKLPPGTVSSHINGFFSLAVFADVVANILLLVDGREMAAGEMTGLNYEI